MILSRLKVNQLRNLQKVDVTLSPTLNVFYGRNGAGKTSVLEAVHFLSQARSFKARNPRQLISHDADGFIVTGEVNRAGSIVRVGVARKKGATEARINAKKVARPSALAECLPVQLIHPGSFSLLVGPRSEKRAYLDWGAFYREPGFRDQWSVFQKALKQRNSAIRSKMASDLICCWDRQLAKAGETISLFRQQYIDKVVEEVPALMAMFASDTRLSVHYAQGWPSGKPLADHLRDTLQADIARGFTAAGPQRGGFDVRFNGHPIGEVGSRGQVKLATIVFKLAQLRVFLDSVQGEGQCLLLLDDLDSELDSGSLARFLEVVSSLGVQTLLTTLNPDRIQGSVSGDLALFHVEHGVVKQVL